MLQNSITECLQMDQNNLLILDDQQTPKAVQIVKDMMKMAGHRLHRGKAIVLKRNARCIYVPLKSMDVYSDEMLGSISMK